MAASSQIGNFDQEFFSLFNRLYKIVDFEAFLGPVRVSPRKTSKNSCGLIWSAGDSKETPNLATRGTFILDWLIDVFGFLFSKTCFPWSLMLT